MLRTIQALAVARSAISSADKLERQHGRRGRLLILVGLPAQMIATSLALSLAARTLAPIRRLRGLPVHPATERIDAVWAALLRENTLGRRMSSRSALRPVSAVLGSAQSGRPNAAALGPGLPTGTVLVLGQLAALPEVQLRAALAHELGHFRLRHTISLSLAVAVLAAAWPSLVRRFMPSRQRTATVSAVISAAVMISAAQRFLETAADNYSAQATRDPESLVGALESLEAARLTAQEAQTGWRPKLRLSLAGHRAGRALLALDTLLDERVFASHPQTSRRIAGLRRPTKSPWRAV